MPSANSATAISMDTPTKTYETTANKSKSLAKGTGRHSVGPTVNKGGSGGVGQPVLDGAHGSKASRNIAC